MRYRTIVGAVVGVQPFGGSGLSGTGPKAGGPNYLPRFAEERAVSNNIAAQGGDPQLRNLQNANSSTACATTAPDVANGYLCFSVGAGLAEAEHVGFDDEIIAFGGP